MNSYFDAQTMTALARRGILVIGMQAQAEGGLFLDSTKRYIINDNGLCRVWTWDEVDEAANAE